MGKIRHWKEHFKPDAEFQWSRRGKFNGKPIEPGTKVPDGIPVNKLRRLWESKWIQLYKAEEETPEPEKKTTLTVDFSKPKVGDLGGGWWEITPVGGEPQKVQGREALDTLLESLKSTEE